MTAVTITPAGGGATAASQAQMEAASANDVMATPANMNWHPGMAKAWLKCGVAGNVLASYNITSITDDGAGLVTVTIATDFSGTNFAILVTASRNAGATFGTMIVNTSIAAGSFQANGFDTTSGAASDPTTWHFVLFGDQ